MLCRDGKLSLFFFSISLIFAILPELLLRLECDILREYFQNTMFVHSLQYGFLNFTLFLAFHGFEYQVAVRSTFLGYVVGIAITIFSTASPSWRMFGVYMAVIAIFHYTEFLAIAWTNPSTLSIDSFVLNHSISYGIAACSSWIEFIVERYYFPDMKKASSISYVGLILSILGELLRKSAIFTAKHNFNHIVQSAKKRNHELITHGIYGIFRHPSYVGWFYWAIGTQLILQNPFCILGYAVASWRFFHDRILIEEITLLNFFGEAYVEYQGKVPTGLPFISGYKTDL
ncbi:protein-S-isoprenylcysteine O-methyltransferase [Vespa velutina]|uniref:protein-S-isoprenylcysteine O-methyltransferase n=1 Tax=Vespa velutina TaxID=202808 RepID=UPI001FB3893C|nr:protein-S-isoprenylcysteine O-methyltransferase [Vespa velutina]XP_047347456.1 protein-S-isoprenylcysteine O-methyltransferase [Vespa velutina]